MTAPKPITQAERLTRIETILESAFGEGGSMSEMKADVKAIRSDLDSDVADLARLKHRGAGILVGVGLACSGFGALLNEHWKSLITSLFGHTS